MKPDIFLFGQGELARVAFEYLKDAEFQKISLVADPEYIAMPEWRKTIVHKFNANLINDSLRVGEAPAHLFLPISYRMMNKVRELKFNRWKEWGGKLLTLIHPSTKIWYGTDIGEGSWIQENCQIQTGSKIGQGTIIWAGSHIGHNASIGDFCWITTGTVICSSCIIKNNCFIGANAVISPEVILAEGTLVGSGAIITKDTEPNSVYLEGRNNRINKNSLDIEMR